MYVGMHINSPDTASFTYNKPHIQRTSTPSPAQRGECAWMWMDRTECPNGPGVYVECMSVCMSLDVREYQPASRLNSV